MSPVKRLICFLTDLGNTWTLVTFGKQTKNLRKKIGILFGVRSFLIHNTTTRLFYFVCAHFFAILYSLMTIHAYFLNDTPIVGSY